MAPIYLDANVFVMMLEQESRTSALLVELLSLSGTTPHFVTSELTLAELLVVPLRQKRELLATIYGDWVGSNDRVATISVGRGVLRSAASVRAEATTLRLPDAIHIATALHAGCDRFLTFDKRLRASVKGAVALDFEPPSDDALQALIAELST